MNVEEDSLMMLLVPEIMTEALERYEILRVIDATEPVGRHLLVVQTKLSESTVRRHVDEMNRAGLLTARPSGMTLTDKGRSLLAPLSHYFQKSPALAEKEKELGRLLSMEKVILVRGDLDIWDTVKKDIAQVTALTLMRIIRDHDVMAVTGGPMMAKTASALPKFHMPVDVLPAGGGFGQKVEYLPNVVAARMAEQLGGEYHILHIPDGLSPELYLQVKNELPQVKAMDALFPKVRILLTGIQDAKDMAASHSLPADVRQRLEKEGAVGEALGLFVDQKGKILYRLYNAGISKEDIPSIPHVLIAAGGHERGAAILAMARAGVRGTLITDEGAAEEILRLAVSETGGYKHHDKNRY